MDNGTRIVQLAPGTNPITVIEGFDEAYSYARGKRAAKKAARQEKRAARKEARQTKRAERKENKMVARQERKTKKAAMKSERKAIKQDARLNRKAARKASRGRGADETTMPDDEMLDGELPNEVGAVPSDEYQDSENMGDEYSEETDDAGYDDSGEYEGDDPDESQTDQQEEWLGESYDGIDGEGVDLSFSDPTKGDNIDLFSSADGRMKKLKRRKKNITRVSRDLNPKITSNQIIVPADQMSSAEGTGLIGLDNMNDVDAPPTRSFFLNFSGNEMLKKVNWTAIGIGVGLGVVAIIAAKKLNVFK